MASIPDLELRSCLSSASPLRRPSLEQLPALGPGNFLEVIGQSVATGIKASLRYHFAHVAGDRSSGPAFSALPTCPWLARCTRRRRRCSPPRPPEKTEASFELKKIFYRSMTEPAALLRQTHGLRRRWHSHAVASSKTQKSQSQKEWKKPRPPGPRASGLLRKGRVGTEGKGLHHAASHNLSHSATQQPWRPLLHGETGAKVLANLRAGISELASQCSPSSSNCSWPSRPELKPHATHTLLKPFLCSYPSKSPG